MRPRRWAAVWDADPNSVAEYLDNTLSPAQIPEFEKVCLESDVHLAEVASCHQILALVLGEPAEVDVKSRERVYALGQPPEPAEASVVPPPKAQPDVDEAEESGRRRLEVPDYLREERTWRRWIPLALATGIAAALIVVVTLVISPFGDAEPLAVLDGNENAATATDVADGAVADGPGSANVIDGTPRDEDARADTPAADETSSADGAADSALATSLPTLSQPPQVADDIPADTGDRPLTEDAPPASEPPLPTDGDVEVPPTVEAETPVIDGDETAAAPVEDVADRLEEQVQRVGRFVSDQALLLRHDRETQTWTRIKTSRRDSAARAHVGAAQVAVGRDAVEWHYGTTLRRQPGRVRAGRRGRRSHTADRTRAYRVDDRRSGGGTTKDRDRPEIGTDHLRRR